MLQNSADGNLPDIQQPGDPKCVVCGEFTNGQHFGKFSCRACAAFFRRTVASKMKYICKFDQNCEISKAVQIHRDSYGKRNIPNVKNVDVELEDPTQTTIYANKSTVDRNNHFPNSTHPTFESMNIPESTYSNNKKSCQVESSLAYDMLIEYFEPFSDLPMNDKEKLFENFQALFSCAEKGYNTSRAYGSMEDNDRLIMTDGGYIKLSDMTKFYSHCDEVRGDPEEVARFFEASITYAVKIAIPALTKAEVDDYIMVAIYGLCLFEEGVSGISKETQKIALNVKDVLLKELYYYFRSKNYSDEEMNLRMSKTLLLIPKFQVSFISHVKDFDTH
uniref:Nuclear receptor domain-containing protein n=1 Tax=Panagrolaimus davidi TaxID=227884 RepID=A0A914QT58_9BILA